MIYSEQVRKASLIAFEAHKDDVDKGGYPYIMHPTYLAFSMDDEDSVCVALLHDVIEDHGDKYSFEFLKNEGFNDTVISALKLLTHDPSVGYMDYVEKIAANPTAKKVKIADLKHNLDATRRKTPSFHKDEIYKKALEYLTSGYTDMIGFELYKLYSGKSSKGRIDRLEKTVKTIIKDEGVSLDSLVYALDEFEGGSSDKDDFSAVLGLIVCSMTVDEGNAKRLYEFFTHCKSAEVIAALKGDYNKFLTDEQKKALL